MSQNFQEKKKISVFDILPTIISVIALIVSVQANIISKENSIPKVIIQDDELLYTTIENKICYEIDRRTYRVKSTANNTFVISNNGGQGVSIKNIFFFYDVDKDSSSHEFLDNLSFYVYERDSKVKVALPINIPPGESIAIEANIENVYPHYSEIEEVLDKDTAVKLIEYLSNLNEGANWGFIFSDGSKRYVNIPADRLYQLSPSDYEKVNETFKCTTQ